MKKDINLLGDDFVTEVSECVKEEKKLNAAQKRYDKLKIEIEKNNNERIKKINVIRLKKIKEINEELNKSKDKLLELRQEIDYVFYRYCEKNGHHDVLIDKKIISSTGRHAFRGGFEATMALTTKCTVCGRQKMERHTGFSGYYVVQNYERKIPHEIYDDTTLLESGRTIKIIESEISELENYINYLLSLKERLCELFGHDARILGNEYFKCKCCEKEMGYQDYINAHYRAKYSGIIPFHYSDPYSIYNLVQEPNNINEEHLNLPTYEEYQKKLVLKKENEDKN